jgi:N-acylglucosamine 2-epimerase
MRSRGRDDFFVENDGSSPVDIGKPLPMHPDNIDHYLAIYRDGLLNDTIPFWTKNAIDREHGGYLTALTREGKVYSTDKPVWVHGRFIWMLSTLYQTTGRAEYLELAKHGVDFLLKHAFDTDGHMFFLLDRKGNPLRKRRYMFSEVFAVMGLAAYGKAAGDASAVQKALQTFKLMAKYQTSPPWTTPKWNPRTRQMKGLVMPMVFISTAQVLRQSTDDPICNEWIDRSIEETERDFLKEEFKAAMETTNADGSFLDTLEGRMLCPGHAIEHAWFILHEAKHRKDDRLKKLGLKILDWMFEWGWDKEYGGIIYYRDVKNLPCVEYWHDMKFWWPQNETIIATLLAHHLTGDEKYARMHQQIHDYAYRVFPDKEHGEWYGYVHRDGRISSDLKGNMWKGPFHLPRMQWYCWQLLEEMKAGK